MIPGVVRTRVGYAGGRKDDPTYHSLGRHIETLQVDFDPDRLSYEKLITMVWKRIAPNGGSISRQYADAIFYQDREQRTLIEASLNDVHGTALDDVSTIVEPLDGFHLAEPYHQNHMLRSKQLFMDFFDGRYEFSAFVHSTVATRLNGYLSGHGGEIQLRNEIDEFGLGSSLADRLRRVVQF